MNGMLEKLCKTDRISANKIKEAQSGLPDTSVRIVELAESLGVAVYKVPLQPGLSGMIVRDDNDGGESGYYIVADSTEARRRRRFTYAHELAHFLLHKKFINKSITDNVLFRSRLSNQQEIEANQLAADILMPYEKIDELINQVGPEHATISILADKFDMSPSAMRVRLGII